MFISVFSIRHFYLLSAYTAAVANPEIPPSRKQSIITTEAPADQDRHKDYKPMRSQFSR